jgi:membrane fusion protein (multidrug efflux system)
MPSTAAFQAAAEPNQTVPTRKDRRHVKRATIAVAALLVGAVAGDFGYDYWTNGRFEVSTDDAYVKADFTTIAPKVSGYLNAVLVEDNQKVKAGQVLARIDDRDFRTALDQANAQVASAKAAIDNLDAQAGLQLSVIDQAKATIAATEASFRFSQADAARYADLAKTGAGSVQRAQATEAARTEQRAGLQRDQAGLLAAQKKLAVLATDRAQAEAELAKAQALARQEELNLSYTLITAPVDGTVGARSLRIGQYVSAGTQLMAVVPLDAVYIVANFKETQLTDVHGGQPVQISVDTFPGVALKGHVDSVSPASGLEFSLLPPDNATGNFTKIVQRIPVKIVLDDPTLAERLRAGMSVEPTIDTKPTNTKSQAAPF